MKLAARCSRKGPALGLLKLLNKPMRHDILADVTIQPKVRLRYAKEWEPTPWVLERPGHEEYRAAAV